MFNRKMLLACVVGSHNYNLNGPNSDVDWKYFVCPTFDDLYDGIMFSKAEQSETVDYDCHDIRKLPELLWKGNINFVEVLFSVDARRVPPLEWLYANADEYSMMNPLATVKSTMGMHFQKMDTLKKGTAKTQVLVDTFGYDTKQACHALRCLFFVSRLAETRSFCRALWFEDDDPQRQILLDVKAGKYSYSEFLEMVVDFQPSPLVEELKGIAPSQRLYNRLQENVREVVRDYIIPF